MSAVDKQFETLPNYIGDYLGTEFVSQDLSTTNKTLYRINIENFSTSLLTRVFSNNQFTSVTLKLDEVVNAQQDIVSVQEDHTTQITDLQTFVTTNTPIISSLVTTVGDLDAGFIELSDYVDEQVNLFTLTIGGINTSISEVEANINTLTANLNTLTDQFIEYTLNNGRGGVYSALGRLKSDAEDNAVSVENVCPDTAHYDANYKTDFDNLIADIQDARDAVNLNTTVGDTTAQNKINTAITLSENIITTINADTNISTEDQAVVTSLMELPLNNLNIVRLNLVSLSGGGTVDLTPLTDRLTELENWRTVAIAQIDALTNPTTIINDLNDTNTSSMYLTGIDNNGEVVKISERGLETRIINKAIEQIGTGGGGGGSGSQQYGVGEVIVSLVFPINGSNFTPSYPDTKTIALTSNINVTSGNYSKSLDSSVSLSYFDNFTIVMIDSREVPLGKSLMYRLIASLELGSSDASEACLFTILQPYSGTTGGLNKLKDILLSNVIASNIINPALKANIRPIVGHLGTSVDFSFTQNRNSLTKLCDISNLNLKIQHGSSNPAPDITAISSMIRSFNIYVQRYYI